MSQSHDADEQEADRAADAIIDSETVAVHPATRDGVLVPRKCGACASGSTLCPECEEEELQGKAEPGARPETAAATRAGEVGGGQPLGPGLRADFEPRFGRDFSDVRVHTGTEAGASARAFDALAYTYGRHVVFGSGQFDSSSTSGRRLIAHELAHVVQQSGGAQPALQRQGMGGPLELRPDVCVTVPGLGTLCGQAAADACAKIPGNPLCSVVCKVFDCSKPKEPKTICPRGWRAAASKNFQGQCCQGTIESANDCCTPGRVAVLDHKCCGPEEVVSDNHCRKTSELPPPPPGSLCPWPGKRAPLGECCFPPLVPKGLACGLPDIKPPKPPQPVLPKAVEIFFNLDRPRESETAAALTSATTAQGKANFDALVMSLKADPGLKVQLIGRASPEGSDAYNHELGARRARLIAAALKNAGISESQIADAPSGDLRSECQSLGTGRVTCGKAGATGAGDRQVLARVFQGNAP